MLTASDTKVARQTELSEMTMLFADHGTLKDQIKVLQDVLRHVWDG